MKKWKWFIVVILVIAVVVAAIYAESTKKTPVRMARVRTGPIQTWVEDKAVTTLPNVRLLTMPMAGRLEPIELEEGDPVSRDQVVARMDTADLETEVAIATARLGEVRAEMTLNAYHDLEQVALVESDRFIQAAADMVSAAEETIKASQEEVDFAEWWFGATKELSDKGGMARVKLKEAQKDFVTARVTLRMDRFMTSAVKAVKEAVDLGPKYVQKWLVRKGLQRKVLQERERAAEAALEKARRDRDRALIKSPIDGVVLKRLVQNRRVLPADAPLLEIGDLDELEVTADLLTEDAALVHAGQEVEIHGPGIGDRFIPGVVRQIKPEGMTKLSSLGVEQQRVAVIIDFDPDGLQKLKEQGRRLGLAFRVRVRIYTDRKEDARVVPRNALFRGEGGQWRVFAVRDGRAEPVPVSVGLQNDRESEILSGLEPGDTVVIAPPRTLESGTRIEEIG